MSFNNKIYRLTGIDSAMALLRPGAKWEIANTTFTKWDDPRPCPSIEEVIKVQELAKEFEDKINTVWLPEQIKEIEEFQNKINEGIK